MPVLSAFHHHAQNEAQYVASPTGLLPTLGSAVVDAELEARFEPMAVSGAARKREGERDSHRRRRVCHRAVRRAVEWRVERALGWAKLRHTPNARKRLLFTYWSQGGGKANVGGDPDDFLDVPATMVRLLREMRARGYDVGPVRRCPIATPSRDGWRSKDPTSATGRRVNWRRAWRAARCGSFRRTSIARGSRRCPTSRRAEIVEMWGPPPGKVGVYTDARGRRSLVVPGLIFGNVDLRAESRLGLPAGREGADVRPARCRRITSISRSSSGCRSRWRADAWVSFFSNISLQGGKPVGPLPDEHIGILLGAVPHIHPERLGANGGSKTKRKALAQTTSWYSIVRPSGTAAQYGELRSAAAAIRVAG